MINQIDGNASVGSQSECEEQAHTCDDDKEEQTDEDESGDDSDESEYDTDDEVDSEPIRPVLVQSQEQPGELTLARVHEDYLQWRVPSAAAGRAVR